ncbi:MAG: hypothetical protein ACK5PB_17605 [Pirellula sp.]
MADSATTIQESILNFTAAVEQMQAASECTDLNARRTIAVAKEAVKIAQESSTFIVRELDS